MRSWWRSVANAGALSPKGRDCRSATTRPSSLDLEPDDGFEQLLGAAVHYRIATGPHAGRKALTLRTVASNPPASNPRIAQVSGFSLHSPPNGAIGGRHALPSP